MNLCRQLVFWLVVVAYHVLSINGWNAEKDLPTRANLPSTREALCEMAAMPHKGLMGKPSHDQILESPLRRDMLRRLVFLLRHSDERVKRAAFELLTAIQPDRPGDTNATEAWEKWLKQLENAHVQNEDEWVKEGWPETEDLFVDIIHVRTHTKWSTKQDLVRDPEGHSVLKRLIRYLRHPDRRVRTSAYQTLINLQGDCPVGKAHVWEVWLKKLEEEVAPKSK